MLEILSLVQGAKQTNFIKRKSVYSTTCGRLAASVLQQAKPHPRPSPTHCDTQHDNWSKKARLPINLIV